MYGKELKFLKYPKLSKYAGLYEQRYWHIEAKYTQIGNNLFTAVCPLLRTER